jgi:hypothetical protein
MEETLSQKTKKLIHFDLERVQRVGLRHCTVAAWAIGIAASDEEFEDATRQAVCQRTIIARLRSDVYSVGAGVGQEVGAKVGKVIGDTIMGSRHVVSLRELHGLLFNACPLMTFHSFAVKGLPHWLVGRDCASRPRISASAKAHIPFHEVLQGGHRPDGPRRARDESGVPCEQVWGARHHAEWKKDERSTCTYFAMQIMYSKCFRNGQDGKRCYMKGPAACLDRGYSIIEITAMGAACTLNLDLTTSVYHKCLKVDTAKSIETPSQIIIKEVQIICNAKDGHACEKQ